MCGIAGFIVFSLKGGRHVALCDIAAAIYHRGPHSMTTSYYHKAALEKVLARHVTARHNHEILLWTLLNLEMWYRQYASNEIAQKQVLPQPSLQDRYG
jgi:hypothetical protein